MECLTILGSAFAVPNPNQENTHLMIETSKRIIMIDCGNHPVARLKKMDIPLDAITDLILTHFHADHVGSLPLLLMDMWLEKRTRPLDIYGLPYTLEKVQQLLDIFDWQKWPGMFAVNFHSVSETSQSTIFSEDQLHLHTLPVKHLVPTIGLRMDFPGRRCSVAYSCDTEPCDAVIKLARGADVLIQESAGKTKGHTSAAQAGEMAAEAGVKRLILIHYDARIPAEKMIQEASGSFNGQIDLARDGMVIS